MEKVEWALENDEQAEAIARAGVDFVRRRLTLERVGHGSGGGRASEQAGHQNLRGVANARPNGLKVSGGTAWAGYGGSNDGCCWGSRKGVA